MLIALVLLSMAGLSVKYFGGKSAPVKVPEVALAHLSTNRQQQVQQQRHLLLANPKDATAWGKYGMLLRAFDFDPQAVECFRRAEELDPTDPRWPYFLALSSRSDNPHEYARALARTVQLTGSDPPAPRYLLTKLLAEEGHFAEADAHASALLQTHSDFTPARLLKAQIALALTNTTAAIDLARNSLDDPRTRKSAAALLASIFQREGNKEAALEAARISASAPVDQRIHDAFDAEISALRGDPRSLTTKIHSLLAARQLPQAAALIDQLTRDHPDFWETWLVQGRLLFLQRNFTGAEQAFRKCLQLDPTSVQGLFQLGLVQLTTSNLTAAAESFRQAIKVKPDFGPAWFNLGIALGRARNFPEASVALQQAIRYSPEYIDSYVLLADLNLQQGNKSQALELLRQAERLDPGEPRLETLRQKIASR